MIKQLKHHIEGTFGQKICYSKDCELLSQQVFEATHRKISTATLRRFYGLLSSKYMPSKYTLDTLSLFVEFTNFEAFKNSITGNKESIWEKTKRETKKITNYTLSSISHNALIDFDKAIHRELINEQLNQFVDSDKNLTALIAPSGYGKSIALAKWVLDFNDTDDILLMTNASICLSLFDYQRVQLDEISLNINNQNSTLSQLLKQPDKIKGKFIIVIDAIDELFYQPSKLTHFYKQLIDLTQQVIVKDWLKIVFSIRESVFNDYLNKEIDLDLLFNYFPIEKYHTAFCTTNTPLLSDNEICKIIPNKELQIQFEILPIQVKEFLRIPINFNLFIEHSKKENNNNISVVNLYRSHFDRNIFKSSFKEEKQDIIWKIIELINAENKNYTVNKSELKLIFPIHLKTGGNFYYAYNELLQIGILSEEHNPNQYGFTNIKIKFIHLSFFYYLYSLKLIDDNKGLNKELFLSISHSNMNIDLKTNIITNLFQLAYEEENLLGIEDIWEINEDILESSSFINTVGACLRIKKGITQKLIETYASNPIAHKYYFTRFVDINYLNNGYSNQVNAYRKHIKETDSEVFVNTLLYYSSFLNMDKPSLEGLFNTLNNRTIDNTTTAYPMGRKYAYTILHKHFIKKQKITISITQLLEQKKITYKTDLFNYKEQYLFEITVCLSLFLIQDYDLMAGIITYSFQNKNNKTLDAHQQFIRRYHYSILKSFLDFSTYKKNGVTNEDSLQHCESFIETYIDVKDSFQYIILICLILMEYYQDNKDKQTFYYNKAMSLAVGANYPFFETLIQQSPFKPTSCDEG